MNRESTYPIHDQFISRVSWRAFSEERLSDEEVMALFEAAHWAPSSYNGQPWRFIYVRRGDKEWELLYGTLVDFNKQWTKNADTLVLIISRKTFEHNEKPSVTHSFDAGAAWMSLALEAHARNIITHGMEGFDYEAARKNLNISDKYDVLAMVAIGKPGDKEKLPPEIAAKEVPSTRKPLQDIVSRGKFNFK